jgi:hypothetical protein
MHFITYRGGSLTVQLYEENGPVTVVDDGFGTPVQAPEPPAPVATLSLECFPAPERQGYCFGPQGALLPETQYTAVSSETSIRFTTDAGPDIAPPNVNSVDLAVVSDQREFLSPIRHVQVASFLSPDGSAPTFLTLRSSEWKFAVLLGSANAAVYFENPPACVVPTVSDLAGNALEFPEDCSIGPGPSTCAIDRAPGRDGPRRTLSWVSACAALWSLQLFRWRAGRKRR